MNSLPFDDRSYQRESWRIRRREVGGRLAIGFPIVDRTVPTPFFLSFAAMEKPSEFTLLAPRVNHGEFVESLVAARNDIARQALDLGCSHLLLMDTDQIYPQDVILKLSQHPGRIVGAPVHRRYPPFDLILMRGELGRYQHVPDSECYSGYLVEVDATGTGCLMIDTEVLIDMEPPWFRVMEHEGRPVGEDIYFCSRAKEMGERIFVDTSIEIDHLTTYRVDRKTRELFKKLHPNGR